MKNDKGLLSDFSDLKEAGKIGNSADGLTALNQLMAKIAHEMRNPLTSIQTYTQLLNEKYSDDELKNFFVSNVTHSLNRLNNLIEKLAAFSDTQDYIFAEEDINDIINSAETLIIRNLPDTHRFSKKLEGSPTSVSVDKKQIVKALYYLVLCIADSTPDGTSVKITAIDKKDDGYTDIVISCRSGLFNEKWEKSLENELSIPVCKKIIEGHRGLIEVETNNGSSAFIVKLPHYNSK